MKVEGMYQVFCDNFNCEKSAFRGLSDGNFVEDLRLRGWRIDYCGKDFCPKHAIIQDMRELAGLITKDSCNLPAMQMELLKQISALEKMS